MRLRIVGTIFRKELRETLRDRRTLIVMLFLPVVLYPVLLLGTFSLTQLRKGQLDRKPSRVLLAGDEVAPVREVFAASKELTLVEPGKLPPHATDAERAALVESKRIDAVVALPEGSATALRRSETLSVAVLVDDTRDESSRAGSRIEKLLSGLRAKLIREALAARQLPPGLAQPMKIARRNVATPKRMGAFFVGKILPTLLVSLLVVGAFYPAIDVTAGEKERATLETLLTSPVSPLEVVTGKFLAVLSVALLAAVVHLVSMGATFAHAVSMIPTSGGAGFAFDVPVSRLLMVFVVLVPLGVLASAMSMAVAVLAHSFKEAQNLLTPTVLILVGPAAIAGAPGMELEPALMLVPGLNTALLTRDLLQGDASLQAIFVVFGANLLFAGLALTVAARFFSSEAVLFGGEGAARGLVRELRAGLGGRGALPSFAGAFGFFVLLFLLLWYGGQSVQAWSPLPGLFISQWGMLLLPAILFALWRRYDLRATFRLRLPSRRGLVGTLLVAVGLPAVISAIVALQNELLPPPQQLVDGMRDFMLKARAEGGDLLLFSAVALSPAVCEEAAFRGVILAGVTTRFGRLGSVVLVAVLFGAFHLSLHRFLPTALAGAALTYLALETGSIFMSALGHGLYNALLVGAAMFFDASAAASVGVMPPWWLLVPSAAALGAGLWLARRSGAVEGARPPL